ncbi:DUF5132 domain-containing protein [Sphaerospermopsis aphanizomenoides BCCUSP55]|uniref:DUF5132 domain-containing protein n=1 Tax=Sphaerospermopsis aphanizomenoides TaxID=459663 RepID=UPI000A41A6ED|nr:DUF5132 domain-containing protein [Sphaerospermopsis aphanizomenoides]MBK1988684.1 DUF5132 domain-containing protein [Sphaerospermopsis aphanizomenoides BCCUSP55]
MASTLDTIFEGLTAIIFSPLILPIASAVKQPVVQNSIKESIILSERLKDSVAEIGQAFEKARADAKRETGDSFSSRTYPDHLTNGNGKSEVAQDFINIISDINADVGRMTGGAADLRVILPLGIALISVRQLFRKGLELDEMPWYVLAWYAFDIFTRLNYEDEEQLTSLSINSVSMEFQEQRSSDSTNTHEYQREN